MSDEQYTPATKDVREAYIVFNFAESGGDAEAEFDRWLAAHDADVARRAKAEERERIAGEIDAVIQQVTNDDEAWGLSQAYGIARADHIEADTTRP